MSAVKKYMTKDPVVIRYDMTLEQVEEIFTKHHLTAAPILDPWDRILGVLSDFMLVKLF